MNNEINITNWVSYSWGEAIEGVYDGFKFKVKNECEYGETPILASFETTYRKPTEILQILKQMGYTYFI